MNNDHQEEYLTRCVVDTACRSFRIYSNLGNEKSVECKTIDEFLSVLDTVRNTLKGEDVIYAEPPVLNV